MASSRGQGGGRLRGRKPPMEPKGKAPEYTEATSSTTSKPSKPAASNFGQAVRTAAQAEGRTGGVAPRSIAGFPGGGGGTSAAAGVKPVTPSRHAMGHEAASAAASSIIAPKVGIERPDRKPPVRRY